MAGEEEGGADVGSTNCGTNDVNFLSHVLASPLLHRLPLIRSEDLEG